MTDKDTRAAKPGELRCIRIIESLEKLSSRPESRLDVQRFLGRLSTQGQAYVKFLIETGPTSSSAAAKACGLSKKQLEEAIQEVENGIAALKA
jgi:hypothetical protein